MSLYFSDSKTNERNLVL